MGRAPCCDKANVKKGPWSPEEDSKLKDYIEKYGTGGNWIALPQKAGLRRCGKSCRLRWLNYLRPNIKHGEFSDEEDRIICALFASIGSRWSVIAAHLPGRTDNDIKNYWNTKLKKKLMAMQFLPPPNCHDFLQTTAVVPQSSPLTTSLHNKDHNLLSTCYYYNQTSTPSSSSSSTSSSNHHHRAEESPAGPVQYYPVVDDPNTLMLPSNDLVKQEEMGFHDEQFHAANSYMPNSLIYNGFSEEDQKLLMFGSYGSGQNNSSYPYWFDGHSSILNGCLGQTTQLEWQQQEDHEMEEVDVKVLNINGTTTGNTTAGAVGGSNYNLSCINNSSSFFTGSAENKTSADFQAEKGVMMYNHYY